MESFSEEPRPQRVTKEVYVIVDAPGLRKKLWIRIGSAWDNRDGSLNVKLHSLPLSGELQIREPRPFDESRRETVMPLA